MELELRENDFDFDFDCFGDGLLLQVRWERIATIALAALLVGMFLYPASSPGSRRGIVMGASGDFALAAE